MQTNTVWMGNGTCFSWNRVIVWLMVVLTMALAGGPDIRNAGAETVKPASTEDKKPKKTWIGMNGSWGRNYHIWSDREYYGYRNSQFGIYYEWVTGPYFDIGPHIEHTYKAELRVATLWGTIPLSDDQVTEEEAAASPGKHSTTLDHKQLVILGIRRWVFFPDYRVRPNLHLGCGLSFTNKLIIDDGTRYAFSFTGGGGLDIDLTDRWTLISEISWEHFSNGGDMYLTNHRVIGPESINGRFGLRYRF